jgi:uncharacterized membrane protein YgcG
VSTPPSSPLSADQPPDPPQIRIGTKERESAYAALNTHLEAGRLDPEEYGDRYAAVSVARTRPELQAPFADLPEPHPFSAPAAPQPTWSERAGAATRRLHMTPALFGVIPFVALALAIITHTWLFFLLIPAAGSIFGRRGWGHHGRGGRGGYGGGGPYNRGGGSYGGNGPYNGGSPGRGGPAGNAGPGSPGIR